MSLQDGERPDAPRRREQEYLRRRVSYERELRGWSRIELARRLARERIHLKENDLYNLESPPPGRRPRVVKVDELAGLAAVFDLPIEELLRPPEVAMTRPVREALTAMEDAQQQMTSAYETYSEALRVLMPLMTTNTTYLRAALEQMAPLEGVLIELYGVVEDLQTFLWDGGADTE